jgi:hypothetical protein
MIVSAFIGVLLGMPDYIDAKLRMTHKAMKNTKKKPPSVNISLIGRFLEI